VPFTVSEWNVDRALQPQTGSGTLDAGSNLEPAERMTPEELKAFFAREYDEVERQIKQLKVKLY